MKCHSVKQHAPASCAVIIIIIAMFRYCHYTAGYFCVTQYVLNVDVAPKKKKGDITALEVADEVQKVTVLCVLDEAKRHLLMLPPSVTLVLKSSVGVFMVEATTKCE